MQRVTISLDDALLAAIDERVGTHGYQGRSEAISDLLRAGLLELEVFAQNTRALRLYEHHGFEAVHALYGHVAEPVPGARPSGLPRR